MSDIVSPILQWLNANPHLSGLATFVISAGESVAVIGTLVPGSIMMTAIGALAGAGVIPFWPTIFWAILGAIVGDQISYWMGHYFKDRIRKSWPFRTHPTLLRSGELFFYKYGAMSVFIGRFVGPVRALVPLVAGMLGMRPLTFTIANVTSAIGWAPLYMLPGLLLGAAALELPPDIAVHVMLVFLLIILFTLLCLWFIYKSLQLFNAQTHQLQTYIWNRLKSSPRLQRLTTILNHYNPRQEHGQLNLFFYAGFIGLIFLGLATWVKLQGANNLVVNDAMYHLFRGLRTPKVDSIMLYITLFGEKTILVPVMAALTAWLFITKRPRAAIHVILLAALSGASIWVLKNAFHSLRPWGIPLATETFSMPSGHTTLATLFYAGIALVLSRNAPKSVRGLLFIIAIFLIGMVGTSRVYLGAHWLTDVFTGVLLGSALLMLVVLSYLRRYEKPIAPWGFLLVFLLSFASVYGVVYRHQPFDKLIASYEPLPHPIMPVNMTDWWQGKNQLPVYRVSLYGFPADRINFEWAGDFNEIRTSLEAQGWGRPPARDLISTLHRLADIQSTQYLPLVSPQYLDRRPSLILTRQNSNKGLLVLRLWDTKQIITESGLTVWVGTVGEVPRAYSWLTQSSPGELLIDPKLVFPVTQTTWDWKIIKVKHPQHHHREQTILLIRATNPTIGNSIV